MRSLHTECAALCSANALSIDCSGGVRKHSYTNIPDTAWQASGEQVNHSEQQANVSKDQTCMPIACVSASHTWQSALVAVKRCRI